MNPVGRSHAGHHNILNHTLNHYLIVWNTGQRMKHIFNGSFQSLHVYIQMGSETSCLR
ncbi:hypothetical protein GCM10028785_04420 [Hydrogenophaga soli]